MTLDERLRLPCGICGQQRSRHVGSVHACFGGYGTYWNPDGEPDPRLVKDKTITTIGKTAVPIGKRGL